MKAAVWVSCVSVFLSGNPGMGQDTSEKAPAQAAVVTSSGVQLQQESLQRDAVRLRELTLELRSMLAASNSGSLPVDALKKAQEVEKLAKSLKQRMGKEK